MVCRRKRWGVPSLKFLDFLVLRQYDDVTPLQSRNVRVDQIKHNSSSIE